MRIEGRHEQTRSQVCDIANCFRLRFRCRGATGDYDRPVRACQRRDPIDRTVDQNDVATRRDLFHGRSKSRGARRAGQIIQAAVGRSSVQQRARGTLEPRDTENFDGGRGRQQRPRRDENGVRMKPQTRFGSNRRQAYAKPRAARRFVNRKERGGFADVLSGSNDEDRARTPFARKFQESAPNSHASDFS